MYTHQVRVNGDYKTRRRISVSYLYAEAARRANGITQGTAQFMARAILEANDANIHVAHETAHDVESFIWVLSYCVMRNLQIRASEEDFQMVPLRLQRVD